MAQQSIYSEMFDKFFNCKNVLNSQEWIFKQKCLMIMGDLHDIWVHFYLYFQIVKALWNEELVAHILKLMKEEF